MNDQSSELPKVAIQSKILHGKRALVIGIANEHSIAYGCARVFRQLGADLAVPGE
jgi:enoyl-[acyl-carrier protein] reductase I